MRAIKALGVILGLLAQPVAAQTTVDVPIDQARVIATQALLAGDTELALRIAEALLNANPNDRAALIVVAAGAPRVGQASEGRRAGSRAFALSQTNEQRYEAARLTALAATNEERFTLATFWLRRALIVAPNEEERARTIRDARIVTQRNPWSTGLSFSLVPSNNVNGGATEDEDDGLDLSRDALALPGVRATLGFSTSYRLSQTPDSQTTVGFRYQLSRVWLEDEGEPKLDSRPDDLIRNEEFATDYYEYSFDHVRALDNGVIGFNFAVGGFDFGLEPYYDFRRVGLRRSVSLTDDLSLNLSARRELQEYDNENIDEARRTTLSSSLSYRLPSGDRVTGTLSHLSSESPNPNFVFDEWSLLGSYSWAEPIGPIALSVNAGFKTADYPDYLFLFSEPGRQDDTFVYGATIVFPEIEYAGFRPGLEIRGSSSDSNFDRFTRDTFSVGFIINSAF